MKFTRKQLFAAVLIIAALLGICLAKPCYGLIRSYMIRSDISRIRNMLKNERYIIHAGGLVQDNEGNAYSYTNSREAMETCYGNGNRVSEFDFMLTKDGYLVCAHDFEDDDPPTLDEFLNSKTEGGFSTMSLDRLAGFMRSHPDFYVVTDIKGNNVEACKLIKDTYPDLVGRFIVQIYHMDEYTPIYELGFRYIIYTLYRADENELKMDVLQKNAAEHVLTGFTFWYYLADDDEFLSGLSATDTPLFIHTVNDMSDMKKYTEKGINGIYTDISDKSLQYR